jgi:hypothetical protein
MEGDSVGKITNIGDNEEEYNTQYMLRYNFLIFIEEVRLENETDRENRGEKKTVRVEEDDKREQNRKSELERREDKTQGSRRREWS